MEFGQMMTKFTDSRRGFALITVLIVAAIGLLFGAGALLLFRYQCQVRIERQHELEKVYAVRSALNYMRTYTGEILDEGKVFRYRTQSERDLRLIVKPVEVVFPNPTDPLHLVMESSVSTRNFRPIVAAGGDQYCESPDFEYGGDTNVLIRTVNFGPFSGLQFYDQSETNNVMWWVNIGMRGTGGWLQEDYGRRYFFQPLDYIVRDSAIGTNDTIRLCLIRNVTNETNSVGRRHGWPLSKEGERALVFQVRPNSSSETSNNAEMTILEYAYISGSVQITPLLSWENCPSLCNMGLQIAGATVSMFYIGNEDTNETDADPSSRGYIFSDVASMSLEIIDYFSREVWVGGKRYGGIVTNAYGRVEAPELRAVFEVERKEGDIPNQNSYDSLTKFKVTPAYQYDVFLEYPSLVTNRATIAQKIGKYIRGGKKYTMLTYDTHGTENRGFRKDEREAEKRRSGQ